MKIPILCVALIACSNMYAQTTIKPGVGVNFTDWSEDPESGEIKSRAGWQIGGSIAFGKKFYIEPGIFYVGKSTEYVTDDTQLEDFEATINGIRIPVALGINLLGNEKTTVSLRAFGGGSAFFVTSVGKDLEKDEIENAHWGVFAGAGLDFWKLFLDASYEWSLTNVQKDVSDVDVGKSRSIFISAGIRINL